MFFHVDGIKLDTRDIDGFGFEFKNEVLVVGIFNMVSSFPTLENITVKAHEFKDDGGLLTIFGDMITQLPINFERIFVTFSINYSFDSTKLVSQQQNISKYFS